MMQSSEPSPTRAGRKIWVVIRFAVFGVGGFVLMMFFSLDLMEQTLAHNRSFADTNPLVSTVLVIVGAALMLFAAGEWGRWASLSVFLSLPLSFALMTVLPQNITDRMGLPGVIAILALMAWAAYLSSRRYYQWRASRTQSEDPR